MGKAGPWIEIPALALALGAFPSIGYIDNTRSSAAAKAAVATESKKLEETCHAQSVKGDIVTWKTTAFGLTQRGHAVIAHSNVETYVIDGKPTSIFTMDVQYGEDKRWESTRAEYLSVSCGSKLSALRID